MKTFVISLSDAKERRKKLSARLIEAGVPFEFFSAITPKDNPENCFRGRRDWISFLETGRMLTPVEVACYASHLQLWRMCQESGEPLVIIEDDVHPSERVKASLSLVENVIDLYGFSRLEPTESAWHYWRNRHERVPKPVVAMQDKLGSIIHPQFMDLRTSAYAISPKAAARLTKASQYICCPVDHFFRRLWQHKQPMFALNQPAFQLSELSELSQIQGNGDDRTDAIYESMGYWQQKMFRRREKLYFSYARHQCSKEISRVRNLYGLAEQPYQ